MLHGGIGNLQPADAVWELCLCSLAHVSLAIVIKLHIITERMLFCRRNLKKIQNKLYGQQEEASLTNFIEMLCAKMCYLHCLHCLTLVESKTDITDITNRLKT